MLMCAVPTPEQVYAKTYSRVRETANLRAQNSLWEIDRINIGCLE